MDVVTADISTLAGETPVLDVSSKLYMRNKIHADIRKLKILIVDDLNASAIMNHTSEITEFIKDKYPEEFI